VGTDKREGQSTTRFALAIARGFSSFQKGNGGIPAGSASLAKRDGCLGTLAASLCRVQCVVVCFGCETSRSEGRCALESRNPEQRKHESDLHDGKVSPDNSVLDLEIATAAAMTI
jgi:hypothetical protein